MSEVRVVFPPQDPAFPNAQNDGLNLEHSTHVRMDRLFISSQDDLQCVKADPEDGWGTDGSYTPDSERANTAQASCTWLHIDLPVDADACAGVLVLCM